MTKAEIQGKIWYHEGQVNIYRNNISNLEGKIYELERLRTKVRTLQATFENKQSLRKRKLSNIFSTKLNVKMISTYTTAMNDLLSGPEYRNAYNGLVSAQERINSQIRSIQNEIQANKNDLDYNSGRVSYWRNQLQYATE